MVLIRYLVLSQRLVEVLAPDYLAQVQRAVPVAVQVAAGGGGGAGNTPSTSPSQRK